METVKFDKNDVQVSAVRFCHDGNEIRFDSYPRRIIYRGREYVLA